MASLNTVYEPGDDVYTISEGGAAHRWTVGQDGTLTPWPGTQYIKTAARSTTWWTCSGCDATGLTAESADIHAKASGHSVRVDTQ